MKDQSFNGLAEKFNRNIYGTTKGRLRHQLLCDVLSEVLAEAPAQNIIELGGGTGVMSAFLAGLGHQLTLTDISEDILTIARQQLDAGIAVRQTDLFDIDDLGEVRQILGDFEPEIGAAGHQAGVGVAGAQFDQLIEAARLVEAGSGGRLSHIGGKRSGKGVIVEPFGPEARGVAHGQGGVADRAIAGAATQVAAQRRFQSLRRQWRGPRAVIFMKGEQRHDDTRGAEAALAAVVFHHGGLARILEV